MSLRFLRRVAVGATVTGFVAGGSIAWIRSQSTQPDAVKEMSAADFNGMQNQRLLQTALNRSHLPWTYHAAKQARSSEPANAANAALGPFTRTASSKIDDYRLIFYRLLGCPYCAKVQAVLQYFDVPYEEVLINPITGDGLPDRRYSLAPQLLFTTLRAPTSAAEAAAINPRDTPAVNANINASLSMADSVFLVDSSSIIQGLAAPLQYEKDLRSARVQETREWITSHFQGASFAMTNHSLRSAYAAYGYLTPEYYQRLYYRIPGSVALYALANLKIIPKLRREPHPLTAAYQAKKRAAATATDATAAAASAAQSEPVRPSNVNEWLEVEVSVFLDRRPAHHRFHGGATPDLADIEMFGVTRVLSDHPQLGSALRSDTAFATWEKSMQEAIASQRA